VRDPSNREKIAHLEAVAAEYPGALTFFRADLLEPGSYDDAMRGCAVVFHTASPYTLNVSDPQRDLVDPATTGTRTVLASANRPASVRRVVATSSCAAIFGDVQDVQAAPGGILTEDVWNISSRPDHQPYS